MSCNILDWRCLFLNEIFGSAILTIVVAVIFYFVVASKIKLGFDTTIAFAIPIILIFSLAFMGFSVVYAFATIFVALLIAWIYNKIIGN